MTSMDTTTSANLIIIQLLHASTNYGDILRISWNKLSRRQKKEIFHFLYTGKQYHIFLSTLRQEIKQDSPVVPWTHLYSILNQLQMLADNDIQKLQEADISLEMHNEFRIDHASLQHLWDDKKQQQQQIHLDNKRQLIESLYFARQQGLNQQRAEILTKLVAHYPTDHEVKNITEQEKEFSARQVLLRATSNPRKRVHHKKNPTDSESSATDIFVKQSLKLAKEHPQLIIDIAIGLHLCDLHKEALDCLNLQKVKKDQVFWYELIFSIEAQQFARALDIINNLKENNLSGENAFSLLYYQAISMHGLGREQKAIQMIKQILRIRPDFKSAGSLLLEWESAR